MDNGGLLSDSGLEPAESKRKRHDLNIYVDSDFDRIWIILSGSCGPRRPPQDVTGRARESREAIDFRVRDGLALNGEFKGLVVGGIKRSERGS